MYASSILVIDDDHELTNLLSEYLGAQGCELHVANNSREGLDMAISDPSLDLILLDVMMPEMDGFEVLKRLRMHCQTPVIMLTARGDDYDRILGLELGADDYLPKPFNHRELSARIKALLRRIEVSSRQEMQHKLDINQVCLDPTTLSVTCQGHPVGLTGTEFSILQILMIHHDHLVSKDVISEKALGRKLVAFDRSIDMHVSNIRKKLANFSPGAKIKTIRGAGYLFLS